MACKANNVERQFENTTSMTTKTMKLCLPQLQEKLKQFPKKLFSDFVRECQTLSQVTNRRTKLTLKLGVSFPSAG